MGIPRNDSSSSRWWSPETIASACPATAHSRNRLSAGSFRTASIRSVISTSVTRVVSVSTSAHCSKSAGLTNRPNTSRYSWSTASDTTSWRRPSRHKLTTFHGGPCHRLEMRMLVSKTTLGLGTAGSDLSDQASDVTGGNARLLRGASRASSEGIEWCGQRPMRDAKPLDELFQNLSVFDLLQPNLHVRHGNLRKGEDITSTSWRQAEERAGWVDAIAVLTRIVRKDSGGMSCRDC